MSEIVAISEPIEPMPSAATPSTRKLAIHGTFWTIFSYGTSQFLRLASNLILARLLTREIFGTMALVLIFIQGLQMFSDIGVGPSVIRAKENDEAFLNTAWTFSVVRGWFLWLVCVALAVPVERFYHIPQFRYVVIVAGLNAVLDGCQSMSVYTQNKKLALKSLTLLSLGTQIAGMATTVTFAYYLRSIWALVIGGLLSATLAMVGSHLILPGIRHRFRWQKKAVHELFHFGKWIFISTIMTFAAGQLDRIMLGKLVPLAVLGVYGFALNLATLPNAAITHIAYSILFPVFARKVDGGREQYAKNVLKARRLLLPIGAAVVSGLVTIAQPFFHWLYKPAYWDAGWMAQFLAIYIWFWMLQVSADRALIALGDTRSVFISNFVNMMVTLLGCLVGFHIAGMHGFIIGLSFSSLCGHVVIEIALFKHGINIFRQDIVATFIAATVTAAALAIGKTSGGFVAGRWHEPVLWIVPNLVLLATLAPVALYVWRELRQRRGNA